ncbi:hypothetical protein WJX81_007905 [Elliptochloris bilobata]|uniref:Sulfite exporter TauE/SafE n=1 Tax=Elliptochloris bilobata TaxID=381761 RepID=A0AAW1SDS9_9CHLO
MKVSQRNAWMARCAVLCAAALLLLSPGALGLKAAAHKRELLASTPDPSSDTQRSFTSELRTSVPALIICLSVGAIATAAGVGGGPIFVPVFSVLAGFSIKAATALSQATITGGAIAGVALSLRRRSPIDPSEPILDFPLALMLTPMLLLGVAVGVLGNNLLPTWLITLLLIVLLLALAYHTFAKAIKLHHKEKKAGVGRSAEANPKPGKGLQAPAEAQGKVAPATEPEAARAANGSAATETGIEAESATCVIELAHNSGNGDLASSQEPCPTACGGLQHSGEGDAAAEPAAEEVPTRPNTARVALQATETALMWAVFLALQVAKTRFDHCTGAYGGLFAAEIVLAVGMCAFFAWQAFHKRQAQAANHLQQPMLADIYGAQPVWTPRRLMRAAFIALIGGFVAGLFGIGGGMIMGPLLLEFGLHPMVSAATSGLMVLFSSSIAAFSFGFDGLLNMQFALIFGLGCFAASLAGVLLVARVVKRSGKASIVVFLLAMVIGIGAILTAIFGGRDAVLSLVARRNIGFGSFCGTAST